MVLLVLGVLLFAGVHLIPSLAPALKASWHGRLGEGGYKGTFSVLLLASFALMITGWRGSQPALVYMPSPALHQVALFLLVIAFLLMVVSARNSRLCLLLRHPQLTGVALWGIAHLLANGEARSIVLFGGLALWAIIEMVLLNRRDGAWIKPNPVPRKKDIILGVAGLTTYVIVAVSHQWIFGFSPFA